MTVYYLPGFLDYVRLLCEDEFFEKGGEDILEFASDSLDYYFGYEITSKKEVIEEIKKQYWCTDVLIADMERSLKC
jgi:hypothetical protein